MLCMAGAAAQRYRAVPAVSENLQNVFAAKMAMLRGKISTSRFRGFPIWRKPHFRADVDGTF